MTFVLFSFLSCSNNEMENDLNDASESFKKLSVKKVEHFSNSLDLKYNDSFEDYNLTISTKITSKNNINDVFANNNKIDILGGILFLNNNKIEGYGLHYYSKNNDKYVINFYKVQRGVFQFKESFLQSDVLMNDIVFYGMKNFTLNNITFLSYCGLKENNYNKNELTLSRDLYNIKNLKLHSKTGVPVLGNGVWCGAAGGCQTGTGDLCKPLLFYCMSVPSSVPICPKSAVSDILVSEYTDEEINDVMVVDKYYDLRDEFLAQTPRGSQYINLYYDSTSYFSEVLDLNLGIAIFKLFPDINESIDKLLDLNYDGQIFGQGLRDSLISVTNEIQRKTKSSVFSEAIDVLEEDISTITGMNRNKIYNYFND